MTGKVTRAVLDAWRDQLADDLCHGKFSDEMPKKRKLRLFSTQEAAKLLDVSDQKVRRMSEGGKMAPPQKINGSKYGYRLSEIHEAKRALYEKTSKKERRAPRATTITVSNFSGGGGKTTTCVHLAHYLAIEGYRVLCIDADPEGTLSRSFGIHLDIPFYVDDPQNPEFDLSLERTLAAFFRPSKHHRPLSDLILPTHWDGFIDIIPASMGLSAVDLEVAIRRNDDALWGFPSHLTEGLEDVSDSYDVVLIDTSGSSAHLALQAISAADLLLVPLRATMIGAYNAIRFVRALHEVVELLHEWEEWPLCCASMQLLISRYDKRQLDQFSVLQRLREVVGVNLLQATFDETSALRSPGESIYEVQADKTNKRIIERAKDMVDAVNIEIYGHIQEAWRKASQ